MENFNIEAMGESKEHGHVENLDALQREFDSAVADLGLLRTKLHQNPDIIWKNSFSFTENELQKKIIALGEKLGIDTSPYKDSVQ